MTERPNAVPVSSYEWRDGSREERLQLMLEAALEGQEAALASQESILAYSTIPGVHREVIKHARAAIRATREAALSLRG